MNRLAFFLCAAALCAAGCAHEEQNESMFKVAGRDEQPAFEYRIDPPDVITIRAPHIAALNGQTRTVGPDGKVSYNLIGRVVARGRTPDEFAADLKAITAKYYEEQVIDIKVEVTAQSKYYLVFGKGAAAPGKYPFTGNNSVISAVADAGLNDQADSSHIRLNRPKRSGTADEALGSTFIDFDRMVGEGKMDQNYILEEGDILYIDITGLDKWNVLTRKALGGFTGAAEMRTLGSNIVRPGQMQPGSASPN